MEKPKNINLPAKFVLLEQLKNSGINTPDSFFLSEKILFLENFQEYLDKFVQNHDGSCFIVRSCMEGEDGDSSSFAGHFVSSGSVSGRDLWGTVKNIFQENLIVKDRLGFEGQVNLMVQNFVTSVYGGVTFAPWKNFDKHFLVEISEGGAENSVQGEGSECFLLGDTEWGKIPEKYLLQNKNQVGNLCEVIIQIREIFDFDLDIEWGVSAEGVVTIFQVRPVTVAVTSLAMVKPSVLDIFSENISENHDLNDLVFNYYGESFGNLSFLSWDILRYCFEESISVFRDIGFKAERFDYLVRFPSGQIYMDEKKYQEFFIKKFGHSFKVGFGKSHDFGRIKKFCKNSEFSGDFSQENLLIYFGFWMLANFYASLESKKSEKFNMSVGEYEVCSELSYKCPVFDKSDSWIDLRDFLKSLFLWELHKIRVKIAGKKILSFMSFSEILESNFEGNSEVILSRYQEELPLSVYHFPVSFGEEKDFGNLELVAGRDNVTGKIFVIKDPVLFRGKIPENIILVAPFFDNRWVLDMDKILGIILVSGGVFSHSAIVAREKNIPYFIHYIDALEVFEDGMAVRLDVGGRRVEIL